MQTDTHTHTHTHTQTDTISEQAAQWIVQLSAAEADPRHAAMAARLQDFIGRTSDVQGTAAEWPEALRRCQVHRRHDAARGHDVKLAGDTLFNAGAGYTTRIGKCDTTFRAAVNNLTDKRYW